MFIAVFLVVFSTLFSPGDVVEVLTVVDESLDTRVTVLEEPITTTVTQSSSSQLYFHSDSSSVSLPHRRRHIKDSTVEGILLGSVYILAFENSTFLNFSLPCPSYELYDPVGLESSVVQIITCEGVSDVLVVTKKNEQYSVVLRISSEHDMSSAAIVIRNGASTAIYYSEENGLGSLMYYPLTKSAVEDVLKPLFFPGDPTCFTGWEVSSYSDNRVALLCSTSNKLFLKNGVDDSLTPVQGTFENPSSVVFVRNKGIAVDITSVGVKIYSNDFNNFVPIPTPLPVRKVDYSLVSGTLYIFMFTSDGKSIYLLNDSKSFNEDFLETLVEETDPMSSISLNSTYISTSGTLAYTVMLHNSWAVKAIDFITLSEYPTVYHPRSPVLVDIRHQSVSSTTTQDHELTTELASTQSTSSLTSFIKSTSSFHLIASSPTGTLSTETSSSLSTESPPTETPSVNPAVAVGVEQDTGMIIGIMLAGVSVAGIVIVIVVISMAFLRVRRSKLRHPLSATDSNVSVTNTVPSQESTAYASQGSSANVSVCSDLPIQESNRSFDQATNV